MDVVGVVAVTGEVGFELRFFPFKNDEESLLVLVP